MANPLVRDRDVDFLLYEVLEADQLCTLVAFAEHDRATFDQFIGSARRLARDVLYPAYRAIDEAPPKLEGGHVRVHPKMREIYARMVELGLVAATRPANVGGLQLPLTVATFAHAYLMAANLSAFGYIGLTTGAAHLVEAFGDDALRARVLPKLYGGSWTGTMALTEPQAGSSLSDVAAIATPAGDGTYRLRGAKIFISGGDHDLAENIVHMTLARIADAPPGIKGVSLFAVPKRRWQADGTLVDNDVAVAGVIHKIGWRGLPSLAMAYGDRGDCHAWLVGEPHRGISYMFQMMNEARLMVGLNGVATASVAYHEALEYARTRPQGRPLGAKDPRTAQVPIIEHADVRRMLLRQKAIVEGGLCLVAWVARYADRAAHATGELRARSQALLDVLTPVAKTFPAERGFEANALALQIHGGYGYSSEYLPEAWLRDQKLNTIHEGTTGIQGLDLLGRKVIAGGGASLAILGAEIEATCARADAAGVDPTWTAALRSAVTQVGGLTMALAVRSPEAMLLHSADYLELFSIVIVAWMWIAQAAAAGKRDGAFYAGKRHAAQYWIHTELPRVGQLAALCERGEDSYARIPSEGF
ncbi:MAG TPA: acyl-CoA dehydrogenase [Kofleriaceae bacterium]|nr:acyl-CoA dehydrogenase [Kofleriaceae bacterium]